MYNNVHMRKINITEARTKLPDLMERVYFKSESFILTRRGIPMAKITPTENKGTIKPKYTAEQRAKVIEEVAGMWKNRWKGKSSTEVVKILRKKAWRYHGR